jgi:hypothetical protein
LPDLQKNDLPRKMFTDIDKDTGQQIWESAMGLVALDWAFEFLIALLG